MASIKGANLRQAERSARRIVLDGHFLAMDKGTTRELISSQIFKVEFLGYERPEIAEFSPGGLDLTRVSQACGLTPKKP